MKLCEIMHKSAWNVYFLQNLTLYMINICNKSLLIKKKKRLRRLEKWLSSKNIGLLFQRNWTEFLAPT